MARYIFFVFLLIHLATAKKHANKPPVDEPLPAEKWPTLAGDSPLVIARGGFSGLFPESSQEAYNMAIQQSDMLYCDLQVTKDGFGYCQRDIRLDNSTSIKDVFKRGEKTYDVNGKKVQGWFALDYTDKQINSGVALIQNIFSRPYMFDKMFPLTNVLNLAFFKVPIWLNVPYDMFYKQHNVDVQGYVSKLKGVDIGFISSPEIGFLKAIGGKMVKAPKLVFEFLDVKEVEPTTKKEYGELVKDLVSIKAFASGILVPKQYIWPVDAKQMLMPHTTLVADAHKLGLEVYASGFANDMPGSLNYSYDPIAEYLKFVDNPDFAVDGVLTDFPATASEAIFCFAHNKTIKPAKGPLIISKNGASSIYPPSTNLAYEQAVEDGADIIDCAVQLSKDGVAFCMPEPDLISSTSAQTTFMPRAALIPEIQKDNGIFSFDLTASEIQSLAPVLTIPDETDKLPRHPENKNKGKIITLSEFLDIAKAKAVSGIMIDIENAPYLASKKGFSVTDIVSNALANATFDKQVTQQVYIQSDDTSVLSYFKNATNYKKVLDIKEQIGTVENQTLDEIKKFADVVIVRRGSLYGDTPMGLSTIPTDVVDKMHSANISVFVAELRNEYTTIPFDFFADPYVEIATYINGYGVDGLITDYPAASSAYKRSPCSKPNISPPATILPVEPGSFLQTFADNATAPSQAPKPTLGPKDIEDPPLPPVLDTSTKSPAEGPTGPAKTSGQTANAANVCLSLVLMMVIGFLSLGQYH
ncbi:hypothetical protein ACHQM5_029850 [Ranunculus cassubicifolius]